MDLEQARKVFPPMWTIYEKPADYPDSIVVRLWWGETPEEHSWVFDTLIEARFMIQSAGGCFPIQRSPTDSPSIVETWL
jgi:hypothetical protein